MLIEKTKGLEWEHIMAWAERVSQPLAENNGWPMCPFARKAIVNKSVRVWRVDNYHDLVELAKNLEPRAWALDVAVFSRSDNLDSMAADINADLGEVYNVVALADNPNHHGDIAGHNPSNGRFPIILLQDRDDLMHRRASLKSTNYYDSWSQWYKDYVLNSI